MGQVFQRVKKIFLLFTGLCISCAAYADHPLNQNQSSTQTPAPKARPAHFKKWHWIGNWLGRPDHLLAKVPKLASWSEEKMKNYSDSLREDGFDPKLALQDNPRLLTMSIGQRRKWMQYLENTWGISRSRLLDQPTLIGHHLSLAELYYLALSPADLTEFRKTTEEQRVIILSGIRATDYQMPYGMMRAIGKRARYHRCLEWLEVIKPRNQYSGTSKPH